MSDTDFVMSPAQISLFQRPSGSPHTVRNRVARRAHLAENKASDKQANTDNALAYMWVKAVTGDGKLHQCCSRGSGSAEVSHGGVKLILQEKEE
ncbi:hypothetical protein ROHU_018841 [Labeo rohita]|uniref:Uncharacterized protein n=1 Tax=Labeo rohita TaxID=84645 RepID=A0A498NB58_LABRO|nr:hypothetical protein ROHU_018841 [Labeo rohita]